MKHIIISLILAVTLALPTYFQDMNTAQNSRAKNQEFRITLVMQDHVLQQSSNN